MLLPEQVRLLFWYLRRNDMKQKKLDHLDLVCLEIAKYNKIHNTYYSYGEYTALVRAGKIISDVVSEKRGKKMIDCSKTTNYLSERRRMTKQQAVGVCKLNCANCPLSEKIMIWIFRVQPLKYSTQKKQLPLSRSGRMNIRRKLI